VTSDHILNIFLGIVLIVASITDLRFQKIPNRLTFPAMAIGLIYHGLTGGLDGLLFSAMGWGLGVGLLIIPYLLGVMGAGDVKLLGAVGALLGPRRTFVAMILASILGGIYGLILFLVKRKQCRASFARYGTMLKTFVCTGYLIPIPADKNENSPKLCYGVAIAAGTLLSVFLDLSGSVFLI
jgi:prepilin peptidase CpaA